MGIQREYNIFLLENQLRHFNKKLWIFNYFVPIFNMVTIIFLAFLKAEFQFGKNLPFFIDILENTKKTYFTYQMANYYVLFGNAIAVLLVAFFLIRMILNPDIDKVTKHKKALKMLLLLSVFLGCVYNFTINLIAWSLEPIFKNDGVIISGLKLMLPFCFYIYYTYKQKGSSLYKQLTIPVAVTISISTNVLSYLAILFVSSFMLLRQNSLIKKVCHGIIIIIMLFFTKKSLLDDSKNESSGTQMELLMLAITILLILILIPVIKKFLSIQTVEQKLNRCFQTLNDLRGENLLKQMKFIEFYQLYNTIVNFIVSKKDLQSNKIEAILSKDPQKVSKLDLLILLEKFLEIQCKNKTKNNSKKRILLLRIRTALNHSQNSLLKELINISEDLGKQRRSNKTYFFQVFDEIVQKFALFYENQLKITSIIEVNNLKDRFEAKVKLFMEKIDAFWEKMSKDQVLISSLDSDLFAALNVMNQLQKTFKQLQTNGNFQKQEKIIELARVFLNSYLQDKRVSNKAIKQTGNIFEQSNLSFMLLENDVIKFVSKELLKEIGERKISYQNSNIQVLFGDFSSVVQELIQNISPQSQASWTVIPIVLNKGMILMKKIQIIWYPCLESNNKFMIKFSNDEKFSRRSLLVYNYESDTINYFNQNFIQKFTIDIQKLTSRIKHTPIIFNELFIDSDATSETIKNNLFDKYGIRCHISLKQFAQKGVSHLVPVEIKALDYQSFENEGKYFLLKINRLKERKILIDRFNMQRESTETTKLRYFAKLCYKRKNYEENELTNRFANEKTFCEIPNHYETEITKKQTKLMENQRCSSKYFISMFFGMLLLSILAYWIMDFNFLHTRTGNYLQKMDQVQNFSEQYALLFQTYSVALSRYYLKNYQMKYLPPGQVSWEVIDENLIKQEQNFLQNFHIKYLDTITNQPSNPINYSLEFEHYSLQTNTKQSTLMDFKQKFWNHIKTSNITFLLKNYDSFRNLTIKLETSFSFQEFTNNIFYQIQTLILIIICTTNVALVVMLLMVLRIERTINTIYSLINKIQPASVKDCIEKLAKQKKEIINIFQQNSMQFKQSLNNKNSESLDRIESSENKFNFSTKKFNAELETKKNIDTTKLDINNSKNESSNLEPNQRIGDEKLLSKIIRKTFFILLLVGFNVLFYYDYSNVLTEKKGMMQVFNMKRQFQAALLNVKRIEVDASYIPTIREFYNNQSMHDPYHSEQISLVTPLPTVMIFDTLKGFGKQARKILETNMCQFSSSFVSGNKKPCSTYLKGFVSKGFTESYDFYIGNSRTVSGQTFQERLPYHCSAESCSLYQEHLTVSKMMGETIRYLIKTYNQQVNDSFEIILSQNKQMTTLKCVGLLALIVLYYFYYRELSKKSILAAKYFTIIPKKLMCTTRLATYLRKNKVLEKLDIL